MFAGMRMLHVGINVTGVSETPATDVQQFVVLFHEVFGVYRLVPRLE